MTPARYHELLSRLFDHELSGAEADELARALNESPALRRDLRQHLVIWELWSQDQAPERSAAAFIRAWKTRLRAESEGAETFAAAVRAELETRQSSGQTREWSEPAARWAGAARIWLGGWYQAVHRRAGLAWAVSLLTIGLLGVVWFATPWSAQATTTITGEAVCRACALHEGHDHSPAVRVVCGKSTRIYYLERNPAVAGLSVCGGPIPVIAKGHARTEGSRLWFQATTLTIQKPEKPKDHPTKSQSPLSPM